MVKFAAGNQLFGGGGRFAVVHARAAGGGWMVCPVRTRTWVRRYPDVAVRVHVPLWDSPLPMRTMSDQGRVGNHRYRLAAEGEVHAEEVAII